MNRIKLSKIDILYVSYTADETKQPFEYSILIRLKDNVHSMLNLDYYTKESFDVNRKKLDSYLRDGDNCFISLDYNK